MLVFKHITRKDSSETGKKLLSDFNFHLIRNEYVEIIAENDAEREELIKISALLAFDYDGDYIIDGVSVKQLNKKELEAFRINNIGLIYNKFNLIDELTLEENMRIPLRYQRKAPPSAQSADELLRRFNLLHRKNQYPSGFSTMIRIKASLAQSLVLSPKLLIVVCELNALKEEEQLELTTLLTELNEEGLSILFITNKEPQVSLAHRKLYINEGKLFPYPVNS